MAVLFFMFYVNLKYNLIVYLAKQHLRASMCPWRATDCDTRQFAII
jgi:hypothetical protein